MKELISASSPQLGNAQAADIDLASSWHHRVAGKKGFTKIQYTSKQAKKDGLAFAWIDTCCIDKSSSTELGEAINSMFRWYEDAHECYVYLIDVHDPTPGNIEFKSSGWFMRGWTLQELLAPRRVDFFTDTWEHLGTRQSFSREISEITRIPSDLLNSYYYRDPDYFDNSYHYRDDNSPSRITRQLRGYSVAQRMSWAAKRKCTRTEDIAYCLLGIFDIHIPLLYGEGNRAFLRLQEEIFRLIDDHFILAWTVTPGSHRCWTQGSVFAASPLDFFNSGNITSLHEELGNPSQIMKKGLQISLPLKYPILPTIPYPYSKYSPWETWHAVLNCAIVSGSLKMRIILPIVRDGSESKAIRGSDCYSRLLIPRYLVEKDDPHFGVENFTTVFLRSHQHRFAHNPFFASPDPFHGGEPPIIPEPVHVHVNGVPIVNKLHSSDKYFRYAVKEAYYMVNGLSHQISENHSLKELITTSDNLILNMDLENSQGLPALSLMVLRWANMEISS
ncbi:hypothetical protein B7463_g9543, partial [Scytalidium lignicola]